jgi:hypothetical protein
MSRESKSLLGWLFSGLHSSEAPDDYTASGYRWLLPIALLIGALVSALVPPLGLLESLVGILAGKFGVAPDAIAGIPAALSASFLLWGIGLFVPTVKRRLGRACATLIIRMVDTVGSCGERLAANRVLGSAVALAFLALGFVLWFEYSDLRTSDKERARQVQLWLGSVTKAVSTATHSVRDIPAFQRVEPLPTYERPDLVAALGEEAAPPVECLAWFVDQVFSPIGDSGGDSQLQEGVRWMQRMRRAVESTQSSAECGGMRPAMDHPGGSLAREAASLYHILLGRSHLRLAADDCSGDWAIQKAHESFLRADSRLHLSSYESGLGNVYACVVRNGTLSDPADSLAGICHSPKDCFDLAIESYKRSSEGFVPCSFQSLRATNNTADLTNKLAAGKWSKNGHNDSLGFIDNRTLATALETLANSMISCFGRDRTPAEASVTLAQTFGTLASAPEASPDRCRVWLEKAGWFLAASVLSAPEGLQSWEVAYFCSAVKETDRALDAGFAHGLDLGVVPEPANSLLRQRILEACP